jgi:hypothetical protein
VNNLFVQFIFSCVFVLSCGMFELIIFEIVGVLDHDLRWVCWKVPTERVAPENAWLTMTNTFPVQVDLYATLALLLFVIPFVIFYLILKDYVALVSLRIS